MDDGFGRYLRICGSKKKAVVGLVLSLVFILGGVYMLIDGAGWFSWVFIGITSLMAIGSGAGLLPGCSYLELDREGFVMCSMFRKNHFLWQDIADVGVYEFGLKSKSVKVVGFNFVEGSSKGKLPKFVCNGADMALPDTFGYEVDELAEIMNEFKKRSGGASGL